VLSQAAAEFPALLFPGNDYWLRSQQLIQRPVGQPSVENASRGVFFLNPKPELANEDAISAAEACKILFG